MDTKPRQINPLYEPGQVVLPPARRSPFQRTFRLLMVLGLTILLLGTRVLPSVRALGADSDPAEDPCSGELVFINIGGEQVSLCAPFTSPLQLIVDDAGDPQVAVAQLYQSDGPGLFNLRAVSPGASPGPGRPVYDGLHASVYDQAVWTLVSSIPEYHVLRGPTGTFWGQVVRGIQIDTLLPLSDSDQMLRSVEWYVEHAGRLWVFIITWETGLDNAAEWQQFSETLSIQPTEPTSSLVPTSELVQPLSASEVVSSQSLTMDALEVQELTDVGTPAWWSGVCNDNNFYPATGVHAYALGASWHGVLACGPFSFYPPYPSHLVRFFPGAWGEFEFQCVELVMRALYLEWGIAPWPGNANTIKNSPPPSITFYPNGTHAIVTGDIITENGTTQNSTGHAVIVTSVNLDPTGTGWLTILEQNSSSGGTRNLHVTNGMVDPDPWTWGQTIQGWLHVIGNQDAPVIISGNVGVGFGILSYTTDVPHTITAASDGSYTLTVPYNWSGTLNPSFPSTSFSPASRSYTNLIVNMSDQSFTATALTNFIFLPLITNGP